MEQTTLTDVMVGAATTLIISEPDCVESCLLVALMVAVVGMEGAV
jgi:hypothetical protein